MKFVYAAELKKKFACYGHFYELKLMNGDRVACRSVLEIVTASATPDTLHELSLALPDAVVVMMNPGSSHPKDIYHIDDEISYPQSAGSLRKELVLTQPDNTQYQLMRIAVEHGWNHIRVLNLSDLRDPKSGSFLTRVHALSEVMGGPTHSIFCPERTEECQHALRRRHDTPVLLGWGQLPGLVPLAAQCMKRLGSTPVCTVASAVHPLLNAHPSPMMQAKKEEWLEQIRIALAQAGCTSISSN